MVGNELILGIAFYIFESFIFGRIIEGGETTGKR